MPEEERLTFEEALKKLEEVVRILESEGVTLEDSLSYYQEGIKLVGLCRKRLKEAEGRLKALSIKNGEIVVEHMSLPGGEGDGA
ncbi:MAG: exodeoxyribonuclease small subunit [Clostridia bacterium]|nr:exodeoxyribonuclease small subunit [Clostridia bacterium]